MTDDEIREAVRERYAASARTHLEARPASGCCGRTGGTRANDAAPAASSCCGVGAIDPISSGLYDPDTEFDSALAASLGCGNPTALAELAPGEDVLDLGSGGGLDVLLSARRVAPGGTAYGLDMTAEMLALAEKNRAAAGIENARFIQGTIEHVPLGDGSVDVVISNCVINLAADKDAVLREAFRVLRPRGRFAVSDIVLLRDVPDALRGVIALWTGCMSGALRDSEYVSKLGDAGFADAAVEVTRRYSRSELEGMADELDPAHLPAGMTPEDAIAALDGAFAAAFIRARRP